MQMTEFNDKNSLRNFFKKVRSEMTEEDKEQIHSMILKNIIGSPEFMEAKEVLTYIASDIEVDTSGAVQTSFDSGKRVFAPRCIRGTNSMDFFEIKSFDDLWDARLEGRIAIPDITTTFGPAMVYMASDYKGADVTADQGAAAFEALKELKPNIVKTYAKSSDLINMFTSGEISAAIVGDFGVPTIQAADQSLVYVTPDVTYANFNTISITKNSKNKELAYEYINYRLSQELQTKTGKALNEAPTNNQVAFTEEESANMTYGDAAENAKVIDYSFVNPILGEWIDQWNRIINS